MRFFKYRMFLLILLVSTAGNIFANNKSELYPDVTIVKSDAQSLVIEWVPQNLKTSTISTKGQDYQAVSFDEGFSRSKTGHPDIPWRAITLGIPGNSKISVQILDQIAETVPDINFVPVPRISQDNRGISLRHFETDPAIYQANINYPESLYSLEKPGKFRDIATQKIYVTPVQYNPQAKTAIYYKKLRLKINYNQDSPQSNRYRPQGKLDKLYSKMLLNFDVAKNWQSQRKMTLKKTSTLPGGTFYKIIVKKDGLYKIGVSTLQSAGVNVSNLSVGSLQMFNNGGRMLNYNVDDDYYNPASTLEIPILVKDLNQNGLFDASDYILFYGKNVSGWFYDPGTKDFIFSQHPFAKENNYLLSINGSNGKRMEIHPLETQSGSIPADFFYDRFHFEEDQYNLLASGPDWYGHRFFGLSAGYNKDFTINTNLDAASEPYFRIQLKGGSGVHYGDNLRYRYYFNIALNNEVLFSNLSFTEGYRNKYTQKLANVNTLKNGTNTLSIQYSGNYDGCVAHLDWFELFYPRAFSTTDNQLTFFTKQYEQPMRYSVTNFSAGSDIYIFDVSNSANPVILGDNLSSSAGTVQFDLPEHTGHRNILISSLDSPAIKTVTSLSAVERSFDLLSTSNQADFLIITHKTFTPYAEELAEMRPHLTSKVVSMDEIYFDFNSGVPDPTALRNFIRYAYLNWQKDAPSYVLLFGDGHYDYRNISLQDTMRVPPFEIYDTGEINSRVTDNYYVDLNYSYSTSFAAINPDLAIGRLPMESTLDARRMLEKIRVYENEPTNDGWQTTITMVADDNERPGVTSEWLHQNQTESMASLSQLQKFLIKKVYLSTYPSMPGGFGRIKPEANADVIDFLNQGSLIINYVGHGSPTQWAHEAVFVMNRDLSRINNPGKLPFLIAATCDFGKFDDPHEPSFTEALIWKEESGVIGALASTRLVYSSQNAAFNENFYRRLFPAGRASVRLGEAKLLATGSNTNDQKYFLFADPTMYLADPRQQVDITSINPDTLKALSQVEVKGKIKIDDQYSSSFSGNAVLIVNDASYDSVDTGGSFNLVKLPGSMIFKGELSVSDGQMTGNFIVPKSIRYSRKNTGRLTIFAWDEQNTISALGYNNSLLLNGSVANINDSDGPEIDIYFKDQESFSSGDLIQQNPILVSAISDENGINITGEAGHTISIQIDDETPKNISGYFVYEKNSFRNGFINYPLSDLEPGEHTLRITAFDNLNNPADQQTTFRIAASSDLILDEVVNYPNPFRGSTTFTFQTNRDGADVKIKIYTVSGRLIQELESVSVSGFNNEINWDGRDRDGDDLANGVYIYKMILKHEGSKKEVIEKLVILR